MAPSDLMSGIVVYKHANYLGESAHTTEPTPGTIAFHPWGRTRLAGGALGAWSDHDAHLSSNF